MTRNCELPYAARATIGIATAAAAVACHHSALQSALHCIQLHRIAPQCCCFCMVTSRCRAPCAPAQAFWSDATSSKTYHVAAVRIYKLMKLIMKAHYSAFLTMYTFPLVSVTVYEYALKLIVMRFRGSSHSKAPVSCNECRPL
jgi:hypothetical protein